ncbi:MAG TPA: alpha/beta hydrolase [Dissulfurispiraceae bacterium]|nr:alpha/beta hydrolase [Dissulfurispiraceae bacterium]
MSSLENCGVGFIVEQKKLYNGITLNYARRGEKADIPVIFLHGYIDSWRSFAGVLSELSPKRYAIAPDLRGHGDSDKPPYGYSIGDFTRDLVLFMDAVELRKADIVGHSMGSFIAQMLAAEYPHLVRRLILISSAPSASDNRVLKEVRSVVDALYDPIDKKFIADFQAPSNPMPQEIMDMIVSESMKVPARIWKDALSGLLEVNHESILHNIAARTRIIWGNQDGIFTRSDQSALLSKIRYSSLREYDAGHALHWEKPQEIAVDIETFLD